MSAVELMSDLNHRRRAVLALGELASERSLDLLFQLATDPQHALHESSIRAIGHLSHSEKRNEIFEILKRIVKNDEPPAINAIRSLRYFDSADAWKIVRNATRSYDKHQLRCEAIKQLAYDDSEESREIVLDVLSGEYFVIEGLETARKLFGPDSLEPDYAILKGGADWPNVHLVFQYGVDGHDFVNRVCERGDADRIFEIIPRVYDEPILQTLSTNLVNRDPPPVDAALEALSSVHCSVVDVAAQIIGRIGDPGSSKKLDAAISRQSSEWTRVRRRITMSEASYSEELEKAKTTLIRLCWAAGRCNARKSLMDLIEMNQNESLFDEVRHAAIQALGHCKLTKSDFAKIEAATKDQNAAVRKSAASILMNQQPKVASRIAGQMLSDRDVFKTLVQHESVNADEAIVSGASSFSYQSVVLPHLIESGDYRTLSSVANDEKNMDRVRLGAIEGLALLADDHADDELVQLGKNEKLDESLRKAAWRALRRSKRKRETSNS